MKFIIQGGKKLSGSIRVSGAKNAATPILAATLLTDERCIIGNVPRIADVESALAILRSMGAEVEWSGDHEVTVCAVHARPGIVDQKLVKSLRSSVLFLGPCLARFNEMDLSEPGGCIIGNRPLDTHHHVLVRLGVSISRSNGTWHFSHNGLRGTEIILLEKSVTATENALMAAVLARGTTVIKNAACEPHVEDLARFLSAQGASVRGAGTSTIIIEGVDRLRGARHVVIPDMIETGTFLMMALATKSKLTLEGTDASHLDVACEKLRMMGAKFAFRGDTIDVLESPPLIAQKIDTRPYPGIPTDLQSIFGVLSTQVQGTTLIHETLFEGRLGYVNELIRMGANAIMCDPHRVLISGPSPLYGTEIRSLDLRAGAAMIIAGLVASGQTIIHEAQIIDRGYEHIEERLLQLGADITRVS